MRWTTAVAMTMLMMTVPADRARSAQTGGASAATARQHPFLLFSMEDVPRMREAAASTHRHPYDLLQAWGRQFLTSRPLPADGLPDNRDAMQVYYENGAACLINLSLLWHLSGDQTCYDAAAGWLSAFCSYPVETDGGYFIGSYALALAAGYDMLYPWLDDAARTRARDHLAAVLDRGVEGTTKDWWSYLRAHHDHWLPAAGLCVGAAAVADETPGGRERLKVLSDHFDRAMEAVGSDGTWTEGVADWAYAMAMAYIWFDVDKRTSGRDLFQSPMVRGNLLYRLYCWLPDDRYVFHHDSFANGRYNTMGAASAHLLRKLAGELSSPQAQWLADREEKQDMAFLAEGRLADAHWLTERYRNVPAAHGAAWNFLWYDPSVARGAAPAQGV
ncbi:MAG: hypothetical protein GX591_04020 [Planctomycetes bacterium]|nr:hypothetical protein [Planctomycetota bacterium]